MYLFVPKKYVEKLQESDSTPVAPGKYALGCSYEVIIKNDLV